MATIVPTTDDQPSVLILRFISELAWADAGPEVAEEQVNRLCDEAAECMVAGKWLELASLMLTSAELVFSNPKLSEKDLECIYTVTCTLVTKTESVEEAHEIAKSICSKIILNPTEKSSLRLKILFNLYNMLESPLIRFYVYTKVLDLSLNGKITEQVAPSIKKIETFMREWNLDVKDQRELLLSVVNVLKESKCSPKDAFKFLTMYLATFSSEDASAIAAAKDEAVQAVIDFIKAPDIFQCDLMGMPVIAQLEKDPKHSLLYELLNIFLTKQLDAYLEFHSANTSELKNYGFVHEDCVAKMRLLSLVELASNDSRQIHYDVIKNTLQITDEEVEQWVVKAITAKLIDCKMDQMNRVVLVSRCLNRVFGEEQWRELRSKLYNWRGNISSVINTIQANKVVEDGSQVIQGLMTR